MSIIRITEGEHITYIEGNWTVFTDVFEASAGNFSHFSAAEETIFGSPQSESEAAWENSYVPVVEISEGSDVLFRVKTIKGNHWTLSEHIEESLRKPLVKAIQFKTEYKIVPVCFNVKQGNPAANDSDGGNITAYFFTTSKRSTEKQVFKNLKYGDTFNIKWDKTKDYSQVQFYADDNDWFLDGGVSNVFCGAVKVQDSLFRKIYESYPKPYSYKPCDGDFYNQCAIRMSIALAGADISLKNVKNKSNPGGQTYCKHGHVLGAYNLSEYLSNTGIFGNFKQFDGTKQNVRQLLRHKTGILFFENFEEEVRGVNSRSNEFRHIEVWNGDRLVSGFDFQMFGATIIKFWEIY